MQVKSIERGVQKEKTGKEVFDTVEAEDEISQM